jgi:hypothetical protein
MVRLKRGRMGTDGRAAAAGDLVARAHARLLSDSSLQFQFTRIPTPTPPSWLPALIKALRAMGPLFRVLFWVAVAAVVLWIAIALARAVLDYRRQRVRQRIGGLVLDRADASLRPASGQVQALLEEADRLAAEHRFSEAAHVLLFRTIADLQGRRPRALRPALTSRDIARLDEIPAQALRAFQVIVDRVERSFFGGRDLGPADFTACREAYLAFASPASWTTGARA